MVYRRSFRPRRTRRTYRPRFNKWRTRGTGRGYRPGFSRFGRVSAPELKSKTLTGRSVIGAQDIEDLVVWPSITQGIGQENRVGNRINSKFLNIKLFLTQTRSPDISLPQDPGFVRWVLWQNKDPTSNAAATIANLSLTSFLNTKTIRIAKTGYVAMNNSAAGKMVKINHNCRNKVVDFKEDSDVSANTAQRYYLTLYSTQQVSYQYQSKFYFADP